MTGYSSSSSPITFSNSITSTGEYRSVLKVKNAFFLDTGYYYCTVNGTTDFSNSLDNVTHVYVYVKGKQKTQILHFLPPLEREIPVMKCFALWSAATFESIPRMKNDTIILALQCLYHFLYLQKNDLYTKFLKIGVYLSWNFETLPIKVMNWKQSSAAEAEYLKFHDIMKLMNWKQRSVAEYLKCHDIMKFSINYTTAWTMMILLLKCII